MFILRNYETRSTVFTCLRVLDEGGSTLLGLKFVVEGELLQLCVVSLVFMSNVVNNTGSKGLLSNTGCGEASLYSTCTVVPHRNWMHSLNPCAGATLIQVPGTYMYLLPTAGIFYRRPGSCCKIEANNNKFGCLGRNREIIGIIPAA